MVHKLLEMRILLKLSLVYFFVYGRKYIKIEEWIRWDWHSQIGFWDLHRYFTGWNRTRLQGTNADSAIRPFNLLHEMRPSKSKSKIMFVPIYLVSLKWNLERKQKKFCIILFCIILHCISPVFSAKWILYTNKYTCNPYRVNSIQRRRMSEGQIISSSVGAHKLEYTPNGQKIVLFFLLMLGSEHKWEGKLDSSVPVS